MNLVNICPDIPDDWRGGVVKTSKILGIDAKTLNKYAALGRRNGGIDWYISRKNGRKVFRGKDIKKFWREFF